MTISSGILKKYKTYQKIAAWLLRRVLAKGVLPRMAMAVN